MRHGILKTKFGRGKDANDMLIRKLSYNFLMHGSIKTTERKAKVLKQHIERMVEKMKERSEANTNVLKRYGVPVSLINSLYEQVPGAIGDLKGGYVRVEKLSIRYSDGAPMAKLSWTKPVVLTTKIEKEEKTQEKPAVKSKKAEKVTKK